MNFWCTRWNFAREYNLSIPFYFGWTANNTNSYWQEFDIFVKSVDTGAKVYHRQYDNAAKCFFSDIFCYMVYAILLETKLVNSWFTHHSSYGLLFTHSEKLASDIFVKCWVVTYSITHWIISFSHLSLIILFVWKTRMATAKGFYNYSSKYKLRYITNYIRNVIWNIFYIV